jgi:hypothetical protein
VTCYVCNKLITENYSQDYWGNPAHKSHTEDTPACAFCARYVVGGFSAGSVSFPDGRRLCGICSATSVTTIAHARRLADAVETSLRGRGLDVSDDGVTYHLVNRDRLQLVARNREHAINGYTDYRMVQASEKPAVESYDVSLLNGLPEIEMAFTLAHELMHVWLFRHHVAIDDEAWIEGSCNYAAYLAMEDVGSKEAAYMNERAATDPDSTYGGGFRRVKRYVDANGMDAWIEALQSRSQPSDDAR